MAVAVAAALLVSGPRSAARPPPTDPIWTLTENPEPADFSQPGAGPKYFTAPITVTAGQEYTFEFSGSITQTNPDKTQTKYDSLYQFVSNGQSTATRCCMDFQIEGHEGTPLQPDHYPSQTVNYDQSHSYEVEFIPPFTGKLEARDINRYQQGTTPHEGSVTLVVYKGAPGSEAGSTKTACGTAARSLPRAADLGEAVHVTCAVDGCYFHKGGSPSDAWLPLDEDAVLKKGDRVSCNPDGAATLVFADGSTVTLSDVVDLTLAAFSGGQDGVYRVEIDLKFGRVAATVNKSAATKSDFKIKSPTGGAGVRGTTFSVFYDAGSKSQTVSTKEGSVLVTPANHRLKAVTVGAGREVYVTRTSESKLARIGMAGARGGVGLGKAAQLVTDAIYKHDLSCHVKRPQGQSIAVKPAPNGWLVTVTLPHAGKSLWHVAHGKYTPANAPAKKLAKKC